MAATMPCFARTPFEIMKILAIGLAAVLAAIAALYLAFWHQPQSEAQMSMNAAWNEFAAEIGEMGALVENAPFNDDEQSAAEGYRHMARFLATFLASQTDYRDPDYPQFTRFPNSVARIGWDNPDNPYLSFHVRGDHVYRLRGNIANFDLVTINVYSGMLGLTPVADIRTISSLASDDLEVDEHGDFVLTLSEAAPSAGNWLALAPDAFIVVVRRVVSDWQKKETGVWEVLNLTTLGTGAPRVAPQSVKHMLESAAHQARRLREMLTLVHRLDFQLKLDPNEISVPETGDPELPMADPFQATSRGAFKLEGGEALIVEAPVPNCVYTNIQLANPWMESLDYASHQSSLNHHTAQVNADGLVRYVVSLEDPGVQNWLDTAGHREGSLFMRWTRCEAYPEAVSTKLIKLETLREHLPADTNFVSPSERKRIIGERQAAISRRF